MYIIYPLSISPFPLSIPPISSLCMYRVVPVEVKTRRENYSDVIPSEKPDVKKRELNIPKTSYEMVDHIKTEEVRYVYMHSHYEMHLFHIYSDY